MSVIYFLVLIGVLVMIHELGHFIAAKLLKFPVSRLSIGFGRPLFRWKIKETEYRLGIFPLGGYVRIQGQEDAEESSLPNKPLWQRLVVVFAGPFANFVLPVIIYFAFFAGHSELPAAVVGDVIEGGPAAVAGIEGGDRILAINGDEIHYFADIERAVQASPGKEMRFSMQRGARTFEKYITPVAKTSRTRDGARKRSGSVGITWAPFVPQIGVIDPASPAGKAGLQTGDQIVSIDGNPVASWSQLKKSFSDAASRHNLSYLRGRPVAGVPELRLLEPGLAAIDPETKHDRRARRTTHTGLFPAEMFVTRVLPGTPAYLAGLRPGDLIVSLDDRPIEHWMLLEQALLANPSRAFKLRWKRGSKDGKVLEFEAMLSQENKKVRDEYGNRATSIVFGAFSDVPRGQNEMAPIDGRFSYALSHALSRTGETVAVLGSGFVDIVRGQAPQMGGPMSVYRAASVSGAKGIDSFLLMIALLSVSVGLINLLPIPALDGGHALIFTVEAVKGRPLSKRARDRLGMFGLTFVAIITVLAVRNDVIRFVLS